MKAKILVVFFSSIAFTSALAQRVNMGTAINTPYEELNPIMSPDGSFLYFSRANSPQSKLGENSEEIWYSEKDEMGNWKAAQPLEQLNIAKYNSVIGISSDGNTLFLKNIYAKNGLVFLNRGYSKVTRSSGGPWGVPEKLRIRRLKDEGDHSTAYMMPKGNTLIISMSTEKGGVLNDLFVTELDTVKRKWSIPKPLTSLNTPFGEDAPFLSEDKKVIYFSSNRGSGGRFDIYRSERTNPNSWTEWSTPTPIPIVSSRSWDSYYKTDETGLLRYWCSTEASIGQADIFYLVEKSIIAMAGKLMNERTKKAIADCSKFKPGENFTIKASTSLAVDSVDIDNKTSIWSGKMLLKNMEELQLETPHYKVKPVKIDRTKAVGGKYSEPIDFWMLPDSITSISGKLLVQDTRLPIPILSNPKFLINGKPATYGNIDFVNGVYSIELPQGKEIELKIVADGYQSIPQKIDLTQSDDYEVRKMDMFVATGQIATLHGKLYDAKTRKPIPNATVRIEVEGSDISVETNPNTGGYEISLPSGKVYKLIGSAPGYLSLPETIDTSSGGNITVIKDIYISKLQIGSAIRLNNVFFEFAKSDLTAESYPELDRVVEYFTENPQLKAEIAGYTDNVGSIHRNIELSQARCQAVVEYLISKGVPKKQLIPTGYGPFRPIATNATASGRAQNRRVEFIVRGF